MGRRPELLKQTLTSLFQYHRFEHIIAINDFGDEATNLVFKEVCPHGHLVDLGKQVGHHAAVDAMYRLVKTPYIFHCEDDWLFTRSPNIHSAKQLLENPIISVVCFRDLDCAAYPERDIKRITTENFNGVSYYLLAKIHSQWHGYTFNPHLTKTMLWEKYAQARFAQFKRERHISRYFRKLGLNVAMLQESSCHHLGDFQSVSQPNIKKSPSTLKALRRKIKYFLLDLIQK